MDIAIRIDDIVAISGKRREGKSYFIKRLLQSMPYEVLVWDINHEYQGNVVTHQLADVYNISISRKHKIVVYQPYNKREEVFNEFCRLCLHLTYKVVVIEEINRYATSYKIPYYCQDLIDRGRHYHLGLIAVSRRSKGVNPIVQSNADHIIAFRQHRPEDVEYLAQFMGPEVFQLPSLPQYWFVHYDNLTGKTQICSKV